tara:strand:- start:1125 stop:1829 length:705 start_codon:yes stop_codon:yes gene_type:complete
MGIITRSYFEAGETMIANAVDLAPNSDLLGNGVSLDQFSAKYERVVLTRLFGYDLYSEFKLQFDIDAATGLWTLKASAIGTKWDQLLNGYSYFVSGEKVRWMGLIFADGGTNDPLQQSLLAQYIYARFLEATAFQNTGIGMSAAQGKNTKRVSANADIAIADNDFYAMAIGNRHNRRNSNRGMWEFEGYYSLLFADDGIRSLYDFLSDMNNEDPTNFPNWKKSEYFKLENRLGL